MHFSLLRDDETETLPQLSATNAVHSEHSMQAYNSDILRTVSKEQSHVVYEIVSLKELNHPFSMRIASQKFAIGPFCRDNFHESNKQVLLYIFVHYRCYFFGTRLTMT